MKAIIHRGNSGRRAEVGVHHDGIGIGDGVISVVERTVVGPVAVGYVLVFQPLSVGSPDERRCLPCSSVLHNVVLMSTYNFIDTLLTSKGYQAAADPGLSKFRDGY